MDPEMCKLPYVLYGIKWTNDSSHFKVTIEASTDMMTKLPNLWKIIQDDVISNNACFKLHKKRNAYKDEAFSV